MNLKVLCHRGLVLVLLLSAAGCAVNRDSKPVPGSDSRAPVTEQVDCIHDVLSIDSELGARRNHATESVSLAAAVRDYVAAIDSVDFGPCPDDFREAFVWHRNAWAESTSFFEDFPDSRGEMHQLFEEIRSEGGGTQSELERLEAAIWDSWREVEAVAADFGAIEPSQEGL